MAAYEGWFGTDTPIVRVMPTTPAAVGQGFSLLLGNAVDVSLKDLRKSCSRLWALGLWVDTEAQIDALVGVTGSGPAYVFLLMECMAAAVGAAPAFRPNRPRAWLARPDHPRRGDARRPAPDIEPGEPAAG